jgi:hypothetical protein
MKTLKNQLTLLSSAAHSSKGRLLIMVATIALFVISAGAPNATITIGK